MTAGDYQVGYGRPPVATRFKPGSSGNPRGRPKAKKSLAQSLDDALHRKITIDNNGKPRRVSFKDLIITGLVNDAARRDPKALRLLFTLIDRHRDEIEQQSANATLTPDDQAIVDSFITGVLGVEKQGGEQPSARNTFTEPSSDDEDDDIKEEQ